MDKVSIRAHLAGIIMILSSTTAANADDTVLLQATRLLDGGDARAAYTMLESQVATYAGNREYDYLLGRAALESGQPNLAIFALERAIASSPEFGGAHIELGRAYYALNEFNAAKSEFETVLQLNPPLNVRELAQQFIAKIDDAVAKQNKFIGGYIEYSFGEDDNANSSTNEQYFGPWKLSANSVKAPSHVQSTTLALSANRKLSANQKWVGSLSAYDQHYADADFVNQRGINFSTGVSQKLQTLTTTVSLQSSLRKYANAQNNNLGNYLNVDFRNNLSDRDMITHYVRFGELRYSNYAAQSLSQIVAGTQYLRVTSIDNDPVMLSTAISIGHDSARSSNSLNAKDQLQIFETINLGLNRKTSLIGRAFLGYLDYQSDFINEQLKGTHRIDVQSSFSLEVEIKPSKQWTVNPQVSIINNRSTIALYDFNRVKSTITLRYHF